MNAADLKQIDSLFKKRLKGLATKTDLEITLSNYPTKDDLKKALSKFVTKDDFKKELANFATKKDLENGLDNLLADIVDAVDKSKAEKSDVVILEKRVTKIEDQLAA